MRTRYVFFAGIELSTGRERWIGAEIETDAPIDLSDFSREHGIDLIPVAGFTREELESVGVYGFEEARLPR